MNRKFTFGALAGVLSLALAVPILAQVSGAQQPGSADEQGQTSEDDTMYRQADATTGGHMGANGMREELLTGDTAAKATAAALVAVPGGTIDRLETDTEGDVYEAHMTKSDGTRVTVKFDAEFAVTRIESGPGGGKMTR